MGRTPKAKQPPLSDFLGEMPATQEELELDEFLEEIGPSTAVVHILRVKNDGSRPQVGKTTMDQIREDPWEYLRGLYGPGKFQLLFRGSDRRIHGAKTIEVEGGATPGAPLQKPDSHERIMDTLLLALIQNLKPQQGPDIGNILAGLAAMMTAIKPADNGAKPVDPLAMFTSIVQMYQGLKPKEEKSELDRLRETAAVIKEFSGEAKDAAGVDSPWGMVTEIGKQVVEKIAPAVTGMMGAPAPRTAQAIPAQPVARPAPAALPVVAGQPTATPAGPAASVEENIQRWLLAQIDFLKKKANLGHEAEFWAGYIIDNGEEPGCQALLYTMRRGATFENLLEFDPEIAQNPQLSMWFKEVFDRVKAELSQSNVDSGGEGRHAGNLVPDVPNSATGQPDGASKDTGTVVS